MAGQSIMRVFFVRFGCLAAFIAALWVVHALNAASGFWMSYAFGLIPREVAGLDGVIAMPLLHGDVPHLISNTAPLILMGGLLAATATRALVTVNAVIVLLGGGLVWLFGSSGIHIGASGLVFGWFGFLIARGLVDRSPLTIGVAVVVVVIYGSLIWGVLPTQSGVSWEAHLFGAIAGAAAAVFVRTHVHNPRMREVEKW
ncbi:MAG: rhomboid family intramembrane serine protease [Pseudomonadota bacterium]